MGEISPFVAEMLVQQGPVSWTCQGGHQGPVLKGFRNVLHLGRPRRIKRESPWRWKPIQDLQFAGREKCSWILSLLLWGHPFMGTGIAARQGLMPVIRWGLEKLLRVEREH